MQPSGSPSIESPVGLSDWIGFSFSQTLIFVGCPENSLTDDQRVVVEQAVSIIMGIISSNVRYSHDTFDGTLAVSEANRQTTTAVRSTALVQSTFTVTAYIEVTYDSAVDTTNDDSISNNATLILEQLSYKMTESLESNDLSSMLTDIARESGFSNDLFDGISAVATAALSETMEVINDPPSVSPTSSPITGGENAENDDQIVLSKTFIVIIIVCGGFFLITVLVCVVYFQCIQSSIASSEKTETVPSYFTANISSNDENVLKSVITESDAALIALPSQDPDDIERDGPVEKVELGN
jgi:hypothetical protein